MTVAPGTRLGVYEITAQIGEGGMGQVFLATDTRLKRQVAIKVLPPSVAADAGRLARFQREAELLAQLNHPNIAQIFGLEGREARDGQDGSFIVMEFVPGETLAGRLTRGPLAIADALPIARQIADALEAAHDRGIVHRDLKPANITVRGDGTVKVLDFGLAKATEPDTAVAPSLTHSPTLASPAMTQAGIILGTAAYMSPEQARGASVDRGADLWAFGVIVMEMLTGAQLFAGATVSDVIASVLARDINWTSLPPDTPPAVRRLLRRCLDRDRKKRLVDAGAAKLEIDDALAGTADAPRESPAPRAKTPARTFLSLVLPTAVAAALVGAGIVWSIARPAPTSPASRIVLSITPPDGVVLNEPGTMTSPPLIAPDGSAVMYTSRATGAVFVRRLDAIDTVKIPNSTANEPFWHGASRVTIPVLDGTARRLLDVRLPDGAPETVARYSANVRGGSWSAKGDVMLGGSPPLTWDTRDALKRMSGEGRVRAVLYPQFFRDGDDFLALFDSDDELDVGVGTLRGGQVVDVKPLFKNETAAGYTPADGGRLLFVRNDNLYSQRFNRGARAMEGEPELVVRGVASQPTLERADFSVAENGAIAWRPGRAGLSQVVVRDRSGARVGTAGPPAPIASIVLAPAGDRLLVDDSPFSLVTAGDAGREKLPAGVDWRGWSAAGRLIGSREADLVALAADGRGVESLGRFAERPFGILVLSPDGQFAIGRARGRAAWARVSAIADAGAWTPLMLNDAIQADCSFSPDGRWILYSEESRVYAQPFPGPGTRRVIASAGVDPVWRRDGREIAYVDGGGVFSVGVSGSGSALAFAAPVRLFGGVRRAHGAVQQSTGLAISSDGSRLFLVEGLEQPESNVIHVMIPAAKAR